MGSYRYLYIGPYIACTAEKVKVAIRVRACTNPACSKPKPQSGWDEVKAKFCDVCGSSVEQTSLEVERYPSSYDVLGEDETLTPLESGSPEDESAIYFGSNLRLSSRSCNIADEEYHLDVCMLDSREEIKLFEEKCASGIDKCRRFYKKVHISWGVHLYRR